MEMKPVRSNDMPTILTPVPDPNTPGRCELDLSCVVEDTLYVYKSTDENFSYVLSGVEFISMHQAYDRNNSVSITGAGELYFFLYKGVAHCTIYGERLHDLLKMEGKDQIYHTQLNNYLAWVKESTFNSLQNIFTGLLCEEAEGLPICISPTYPILNQEITLSVKGIHPGTLVVYHSVLNPVTVKLTGCNFVDIDNSHSTTDYVIFKDRCTIYLYKEKGSLFYSIEPYNMKAHLAYKYRGYVLSTQVSTFACDVRHIRG